MMKLILVIALPIVLASCGVTPARTSGDVAFRPVREVLETNCVHCHGDNRLSTMPPINDSRALARLVGVGSWIVPGNPDGSRFFHVVTFPDEVPGAMPPTGHAISKKEVEILRAWIQAGATVPTRDVIKFTPRGEMPRSI